MHSLNLKPTRGGPLGSGIPGAASRRLPVGVGVRLPHPPARRRLLLLCLSSSEDKNNNNHSTTHTYAFLKHKMDLAAKSQDFEEAARLRDALRDFEEREPVLRMEKLLKEAIADQRFEDAARCRDELNKINPQSFLKCSSDATTLGIRVQVRSVYVDTRSQPLKGQYVFAYRIRITNNSSRPVQLLQRHWIITDAKDKIEHVWGSGVIGEQPVILPDTQFEYTSACPLRTSSGRMEGDFEMKHVDKAYTETFNVAIAPFSLSTIGDGTGSL